MPGAGGRQEAGANLRLVRVHLAYYRSTCERRCYAHSRASLFPAGDRWVDHAGNAKMPPELAGVLIAEITVKMKPQPSGLGAPHI